MFNSKLRKTAIDNYNAAVDKYEKTASDLGENASLLFTEREKALATIKLVEERINKIANSPKEFSVTLKKIKVERENFDVKKEEIKKAEKAAKLAAGGSGTGASLSALGIAVATMGPTAAMGIATTFGVASTGTAISTLSGAAATNAALAWLGGGALAAGGGGMSAGSAFLALAGPVGWTIAGIAMAGSVGSGLWASYKNKEAAEKLVKERKNIETIIRKFNSKNAEIKALIDTTRTQNNGVTAAKKVLAGDDYSLFSTEEKNNAAILVNSTLTLAQLINEEIKLND